ncbi:MAG: hypothetical protein ACTSQE_12800 [Candidatus Heimdallarchaeaceae archaeon]
MSSSYQLFIIIASSTYAFIITVIVIILQWNKQLNKTVKAKTSELEHFSNNLSFIFDLLTHDMGNLLFAVYNINLINSLKNKDYESSTSLALIQESIFKIKFASQLISKLSGQLTQKEFVPIKEYILNRYREHMIENSLEKELEINFADGLDDYYLVADQNFSLLCSYLIYQVLLGHKDSYRLNVVLCSQGHMINLEFYVDLSSKFETVNITGNKNCKSLEAMFIDRVMKSLGGFYTYTKEKITLSLPCVKFPLQTKKEIKMEETGNNKKY